MTDRTNTARLIESLRDRLRQKPEKAVSDDHPAVAVLDAGLRCHLSSGDTDVITDMPAGLGGRETAPTPGWYLRAAVASCFATSIAMRAAELDIEINRLEVRACSTSDSRGLLGLGEHPVGMLGVDVHVHIEASGAANAALAELVRYADRHSPVSATIRIATPVEYTIG
jgi:uncharacterized OsmC-like protein